MSATARSTIPGKTGAGVPNSEIGGAILLEDSTSNDMGPELSRSGLYWDHKNKDWRL
jgi:hypothetical protein